MLFHLETRIHAIYRKTRSAKGLGKHGVAQSIDTHSGAKDVEFHTHEFSAFCIAATASLSSLQMQTALAQEQDQETSDANMEEVVVTGSRVRRLDTESASPIVTIDQAAIEKVGRHDRR